MAYVVGNSLVTSLDYPVPDGKWSALVRTLLDAGSSTSDTRWRTEDGVEIGVERSKYEVEGRKPKYEPVEASRFEVDPSSIPTPSVCEQIAQVLIYDRPSASDFERRWMDFWSKKASLTYRQNPDMSAMFHAIEGEIPYYVAQITRDFDDDFRCKVLIDVDLLKVKNIEKTLVVLAADTSKNFFIVHISDLAGAIGSAKVTTVKGRAYYKLFIRGLTEGSPGVFSRANEKTARLNLLEHDASGLMETLEQPVFRE
jgi:hypothetical protein